MANRDSAQGLQPHGKVCRQSPYVAGEQIYPGAPVKRNSAGKVVNAAAGDRLLGAAVNHATADGKQVLVLDDPQQLFVIQAAGSAVDAQTDIGNNADISVAVDATYKISRAELDDTTLTAVSSAQLQLIRIEELIDNALGANVKCIVRINEHELVDGSTGV